MINELKDIRDLEIINPLPLKDITNQFGGGKQPLPQVDLLISPVFIKIF